MRVLVFHGYLLGGTGSNVYTANLASALVAAGHEVYLLSQERDPFAQPWVDAAGNFDTGALRVVVRRAPVRATVYRPDIGGVLPVYVPDRYPGIEARPFAELSDAELDRYVAANVAAVREVALLAGPDVVALANHLVMGPLILARALAPLGVPYAVKIHGSALEYTVKPHPRFLPHAREGIAPARGILVGSRHIAESLWAALDDPTLPTRTRLGPPGVDTARFILRRPDEALAGLAGLAARLLRMGAEEEASEAGAEEDGVGGNVARQAGELGAEAPPHGGEAGEAAGASSFARDQRAAGEALAGLDLGRARLIAFVGKLIASKGVELALAALPLVARGLPDARLVIVGFGPLRPALERFVEALGRGDLAAARRLRGEKGEVLSALDAFLGSLAGEEARAYVEGARGLERRVHWTGRLEHDELAELLPAVEALIVPSTFPEAFGMVAVEAAACGALPVVARHSGLAEVAAALAPELPDPVRPWLTFPVDAWAVPELAAATTSWLSAPAPLRAVTREALAATATRRYGWDAVARTVLLAARGELADLPSPGDP